MENRYFELYDKAPVGYITVSALGVLLESNDTAKFMLSLGPNDTSGLNIKSYVLKSDLEKYEKAIKRTMATKKVQITELRMKKNSKKTVWIQMRLVKERTAIHKGACRIILIDITERRQIGRAIVTKKELLETTLTAAGDGVISTDKRGNVVFMNTVAEMLTGWTQDLALNQPATLVFNVIGKKTRKNRSGIVKRAFDSEVTKKISSPTLLIAKDGKERSIEASVAPIILQSGETVGVVVVMQDCTEKKRKETETLFQNYHDHLTGLYNRRFYEEQLKKIDNKKNLPITLIMADVNGLKCINDTFGHAAGDELLKMTATIIQDSCRSGDIATRLGGDEFMIILPKADQNDAERILKRIQAHCCEKTIESRPVSIAFGHATKRLEEESMDSICKDAEDNMYCNKQQEGLGRENLKSV